MTWKCENCNSFNPEIIREEGGIEKENNKCEECGRSRLK